ncbi:MAG: hypothetical protein COB36_10375 [Alphaproteobacteria bacterium]|nr:MAG: hypothetical protein COB36_10375 [Alphaproteobacteria bacterium]
MKIMKKILKIAGILLALILIVPVGLGLTLKGLSPEIPMPGKLFDVGGHKLHIHCTGPDNDLPPVIVEAGLGGPTSLYHWVQKNLSTTGKVCTYDRAGLGYSEESGVAHDAENMTTQLHVLLEKAGIRKPFVLAGHSLAGLIMRTYVGKYPEDVVGVAFLDASHPNQNEVLKFGDDGSTGKMEELYGWFKLLNNLGLTKIYNPVTAMVEGYLPDEVIAQMEFTTGNVYYDASVAEMGGFDASAEQASQAGDLADRPVVVITAGKLLEKEYLPDHIDPVELRAAWIGLNKDLANLSSKGRQVVINEADHMSLLYDKKLADQASDLIREIVEQSAHNMMKAEGAVKGN